MAKTSPIRIALSKWPPERFSDPDFADFWEFRFAGYEPQDVADAIIAVKLESDPYVPTCEQVSAYLAKTGVSQRSAWDATAFQKSLAEGVAQEQQNAADDELCKRLSDEEFGRIAAIVLERARPEYRALISGKDLRRRQSMRSAVAALVRSESRVPA